MQPAIFKVKQECFQSKQMKNPVTRFFLFFIIEGHFHSLPVGIFVFFWWSNNPNHRLSWVRQIQKNKTIILLHPSASGRVAGRLCKMKLKLTPSSSTEAGIELSLALYTAMTLKRKNTLKGRVMQCI